MLSNYPSWWLNIRYFDGFGIIKTQKENQVCHRMLIECHSSMMIVLSINPESSNWVQFMEVCPNVWLFLGFHDIFMKQPFLHCTNWTSFFESHDLCFNSAIFGDYCHWFIIIFSYFILFYFLLCFIFNLYLLVMKRNKQNKMEKE